MDLGRRATASGQVLAFTDALASADVLCHEAAHKISAAAIADGEDPSRWLSTVATRSVCLDGLLHGVFDSYLPAHADDPVLVKRLLDVCASLSPEFAAACADGAGHGLYQASHDPLQALDGCLLLEGLSLQESCVGGVAMQMFRPEADGSRPADYTLGEVATAGVEFCEDVARVASDRLAQGCVIGLTLPYTEELDRETRNVTADRREDLDKVKDRWLEKATGCSQFAPWTAICRDALGTRVGFSTMAFPETRSILCEPQVLRRACLSVTPLSS